MDVQHYVEQYFTNKHVPFKGNVKIHTMSSICAEFDLVLPHTLIEIKGGKYKQIDGIYLKKLVQQLERLEKYTPKHINIWLYFHEKQKPEIIDVIKRYGRIKVTDGLDNIHIDLSEYTLYTNVSGALRSLSSLLNTNRHQINEWYGPLTVDRTTYYKTIANMCREELSMLNSIDMCFTDTKPILSMSVILKNNQPTKYCDLEHVGTLWRNFDIEIQSYSINVTTELMYISGITFQCKQCHRIFFEHYIVGDICKSCDKHRLS